MHSSFVQHSTEQNSTFCDARSSSSASRIMALFFCAAARAAAMIFFRAYADAGSVLGLRCRFISWRSFRHMQGTAVLFVAPLCSTKACHRRTPSEELQNQNDLRSLWSTSGYGDRERVWRLKAASDPTCLSCSLALEDLGNIILMARESKRGRAVSWQHHMLRQFQASLGTREGSLPGSVAPCSSVSRETRTLTFCG